MKVILKFDFVENEKSFRKEIKKHFSSFHKCSLLELRTNINEAETTFNKWITEGFEISDNYYNIIPLH